jgi:competence protein CoiA
MSFRSRGRNDKYDLENRAREAYYMPFIGKLKASGERIDITKYEAPRTVFGRGDVVCRFCEEEFIVRHGLNTRAHFAHKAKCTSDMQSHPESEEHLAGKEFIANYVRQAVAHFRQTRVEYEYPVPDARRIIDVAFIFENGWVVAHEIQLASITARELEERSNDYLRAGVDVIWWLGKSADTPANRQWCMDRQGYSLSFTIEAFTTMLQLNTK